jgi:hypothetical protein
MLNRATHARAIGTYLRAQFVAHHLEYAQFFTWFFYKGHFKHDYVFDVYNVLYKGGIIIEYITLLLYSWKLHSVVNSAIATSTLVLAIMKMLLGFGVALILKTVLNPIIVNYRGIYRTKYDSKCRAKFHLQIYISQFRIIIASEKFMPVLEPSRFTSNA